MGAGPVPVALHRLGIQGDDDAELFRYPVQQEAGHPQLVADADALAGAHLEFPLEEKTEFTKGALL